MVGTVYMGKRGQKVVGLPPTLEVEALGGGRPRLSHYWPTAGGLHITQYGLMPAIIEDDSSDGPPAPPIAFLPHLITWD